jgi:hypothetical protein
MADPPKDDVARRRAAVERELERGGEDSEPDLVETVGEEQRRERERAEADDPDAG